MFKDGHHELNSEAFRWVSAGSKELRGFQRGIVAVSGASSGLIEDPGDLRDVSGGSGGLREVPGCPNDVPEGFREF